MSTSPIDKDKRITELEQEVKTLKSLVMELMAINKSLLERLAKIENPRNSRNSSMPPESQ